MTSRRDHHALRVGALPWIPDLAAPFDLETIEGLPRLRALMDGATDARADA
jgi:hypothetical protein